MSLPSVRDAFFSEIYRMTEQGEDIVIVSADLGAPSLDEFRRKFPHRFVNVGIAEQNLLSVATGLALSGKHVIAFGLNPFPVTRAYDQLRNFLGDLRIPITVAALNTGTCSTECGYTHMPLEDFAMVRMIPSIKMVNPSDTSIAKAAARELVISSLPTYIRFDKFLTKEYYQESEVDFQKGFFEMHSSKRFAVITTGNFSAMLKESISTVAIQGETPSLFDCYAFPLDADLLAERLKSFSCIVTLEDQTPCAGLGSLIMEILSKHGLVKPIRSLGIESKYWEGRIMNRNAIYDEMGYDIKSLGKRLQKTFEEMMDND
ncbi:hypothetical protein [uncultured Selenomonas sp.]|uniref:hypothetical protein n=1 Tax=uncultured Selenomonas sp. TaxID=159275 RepID=UPI002676FD27|nr:hypothetical protein [uncultured Selenomonas sp.]